MNVSKIFETPDGFERIPLDVVEKLQNGWAVDVTFLLLGGDFVDCRPFDVVGGE